MSLSDASTSRPVAMSCLLIGLAFLGGNAYRKIGLEMIPQVDIPYVTVVTAYPGASPEDVESDVAKRIEDAVSSVDGLKNLQSKCLEDLCQTVMEFELEIDVDVAAQDVREKIDAIINDFPGGVERPVIQKFDIGAKAILTLVLRGELDIDTIYDYVDETLGDRFAAIPGVAESQIIGGAEREVHIVLDRDRLASTGLTSLDVLTAVQNGVVRVPAGRIRTEREEYSVQFQADYTDMQLLADLQIAGLDGARAYLRDLGTVRYGTEERRQAAYFRGEPAIGIQIVKRSDANAVDVVNRVRALYNEYQQPGALPAGLSLEWFRDDGEFIQATVNSTTFNIIDGVLMTAAILFVFLWNARTTLVVAVSMPMTIIVGLFFVNQLGYTLNTMTLIAIGLSVGVLVSNSIVVLENIESHFRRHGDSWKAAREGTNEVAVAVLASAGTNIVVMFPIAIMGGMVGRMFRQFAWTTVAVNGASLFISFTLTPILAAVFLRPVAAGSLSERMGHHVDHGIRAIASGFMRRLARVGTSRALSGMGLVLATAAMVGVVMLGGTRLGFTMAPETDNGEITIRFEYPSYQNLETTTRRILEAEGKIRDVVGLLDLFTFAGRCDGMGAQATEGVYLGQISMRLHHKDQPGRQGRTIFEIIDEVRERLGDEDDVIVTAGLTSIFGGQNIPVELEIRGDDVDRLEEIVEGILADMRPGGKLVGFVSPDSTVRAGKPQLRVEPNRAILADAQWPVSQLGLLLRTNLEGTKAGTFRTGARTFDIRTKFEEIAGKSQVGDFLFPTDGDAAVTLETYADVIDSDVRVMISRSGKSRAASLFAQLEPGAALGTAMAQLDTHIKENNLLPAGYVAMFQGSGQDLGETIGYFVEAVLLALVMTYLMLGAILESFTLPLYIYITIPLGLVGVILALVFTGLNVSIFVMLGIVMLIGIVVNNAVLVIDRMNQYRAQGIPDGLAMKQAVVKEMRAVLMVTFAATAGMAPLAMASGLGSEMTSPIGWASIGGIVVSSVMLLLILPLMWWILHPIRPGEEDIPAPETEADYVPGAGSSSRRFRREDGTLQIERPGAGPEATVMMKNPFEAKPE